MRGHPKSSVSLRESDQEAWWLDAHLGRESDQAARPQAPTDVVTTNMGPSSNATRSSKAFDVALTTCPVCPLPPDRNLVTDTMVLVLQRRSVGPRSAARR